MVILADAQREIGSLKDANVEFDVNDKKMFTVQIARCYWTQSLTFDAWCTSRIRNTVES